MEIIKNALRNNTFFWVFSIISAVLLIASFILPPLGIIDSSVLAAVGELAGMIALGCVCKAIDEGYDAKIKHNETEINLNK